MNLADFRVLTFDCYGTLIDWEAGILAELRPWAARQGGRIDDDALLSAFGQAEAAAELETPAAPYPEILAATLRTLGLRWSIPVSDAQALEFGGSVGRWPAFPDSAAALAYLKRHYRLVILSNVDRASFAQSNRRLGVEFDLVCTAQDIGSYKPDPRNFRYVIDAVGRLGVPPGGILHVAQSLFHDHVPARAAGLATLWINRRKAAGGWGATPAPAEVPQPDWEVPSMAAFVELHRASAGRASGSETP